MERETLLDADEEAIEALRIRRDLRERLSADPKMLWPRFRLCPLRVLCIADGMLDFSEADFGLSTFVRSLLAGSIPALCMITLAHLQNRSGDAMMDNNNRIVRRIPNFKFDDSDHFKPDAYDVVFLFGIESTLSGRGDHARYPADRLGDAELQAIAEFQNSGGGLFATGDHGALGKFMGASLPRAGKMRLWESTSFDDNLDEVSMGGPRRNDTNRPGDPGSQFEDQSDDIPQQIQPRMYTVRNGLFRYSFPHPLLCGPNGVIGVMPDHPHEGECIAPTDIDDDLNFTGNLGPEYPPATYGGPKPLPEIISTNSVFSGTTSGGKMPTRAQAFGGICAYDGHRAGIGRCVTDATWHHFVNVNLVGMADLNDSSVKSLGFLASAQGRQHLANIRAYYRNLATWLARPDNIRCMNRGWLYWAYANARVMEAVMTRTDLPREKLSTLNLWEIGQHARDALGKFASRCQARRLALEIIWRHRYPPLEFFNPWYVDDLVHDDPWQMIGGGINWVNTDHVLDIALGGAIAAMNDGLRELDAEEVDADIVEKFAAEGAQKGYQLAMDAMRETFKATEERFRNRYSK